MLLTVTLNPAVDRTYRVEGFSLDRVHRPSGLCVSAGGKGISVSRVFHTLGGKSTATGFLGGCNGEVIERSLNSAGIPEAFVRISSETRFCIALIDPKTGVQTEVNEAGPIISAAELQRFKWRYEDLLSSGYWSFAAICGSLPPGVPVDIYADLIYMARRAGVRCALDASGEALLAGIAAGPWMVKPNRFELETALHGRFESEKEILEAAESIRGMGVENVAITRGKEGAIFASESGRWRASPPAIDFVSAVGSGDSFLAAVLKRLEEGGSYPEALRWGVAAGAANTGTIGAGYASCEYIEACVERVHVEPLSNVWMTSTTLPQKAPIIQLPQSLSAEPGRETDSLRRSSGRSCAAGPTNRRAQVTSARRLAIRSSTAASGIGRTKSRKAYSHGVR